MSRVSTADAGAGSRLRGFRLLRPVSLLPAVEAVLRRAERQGSISSRQVREELAHLGRNQDLWKEVVRAAGDRLAYRQGRYHYVPPFSPIRQQQECRDQDIHLAVHYLVEQYRKELGRQERREADRFSFIQTVAIRDEDGRESQVLTRDISASGIRLIGTEDLLGRKLQVTIPTVDGGSRSFVIRILWTCRVADGLYENGGRFLEVVRPS